MTFDEFLACYANYFVSWLILELLFLVGPDFTPSFLMKQSIRQACSLFSLQRLRDDRTYSTRH